MKQKIRLNKMIIEICSLIVFLNLFVTNVKATDIPKDINIWSTPKVIHIKNDDILKKFIFLDQYHNAQQVTYASKQIYLTTYKQDILVGNTSMSVEILGHIYPDEFSKYLPSNIVEEIRKHTNVIDSGEKSVDSNRWVWDSIAAVIDYFKPSNNSREYQDLSIKTILSKIHQINSNEYLDNEIMTKVIKEYKSNANKFAIKYY
ncbi:hypothetical protein [Lactobacillus sp. ESL0230]|uniref:hypothetical protein n=1 Tax=Lactobacillus sp. ESL0230 TaxID=2069353 RepID=UPI000EFB90B0|nr:hypothetical protein [Lactobacillus sp. ESL0230]RMC46736.1 hypothetical protein F5ESL0230_05650 [Lactobacillus sp. ESL0230]